MVLEDVTELYVPWRVYPRWWCWYVLQRLLWRTNQAQEDSPKRKQYLHGTFFVQIGTTQC
jgi:hypothetical protein